MSAIRRGFYGALRGSPDHWLVGAASANISDGALVTAPVNERNSAARDVVLPLVLKRGCHVGRGAGVPGGGGSSMAGIADWLRV